MEKKKYTHKKDFFPIAETDASANIMPDLETEFSAMNSNFIRHITSASISNSARFGIESESERDIHRENRDNSKKLIIKKVVYLPF